MENSVQMIVAMIVYMLTVIGIGIYFAKRANKSTDEYFIGGRSLGPWIASMSAESSDMSGWLLMGLPGVAYFTGVADAFWTAVGLIFGTYINWLVVSRRLRRYSTVVDAITIPDFFSNRFHEDKKVIMGIAAIFIFIFYTVYASSCFVTCGKLFSTLFNLPYTTMLIIGAVFVVIYTVLGGFLAESTSDFMQACVMIIALVAVMLCTSAALNGFENIFNNVRDYPGFLNIFGIASPSVDENEIQLVADGAPQFGAAGKYGLISVISTLAWGLGYFGMPQVLLRFMAIRHSSELKRARRIGTTWCVISLAAAVLIGLAGRALFPTDAALLSSSGAESVFIILATRFLPPILAGLACAGILAAIISSSDSYLLIAASSFSINLYKGLFKKNASDRQVLICSRIVLVSIAAAGVLIALNQDSVIFKIVSFAWAGFGATFGPLMLFSLFWKRINRAGAIAGMISGGSMVFIYKFLLRPLGGAWNIYELLPAFVVSCIAIIVASLLSKAPSKQICEDFEKAKTFNC